MFYDTINIRVHLYYRHGRRTQFKNDIVIDEITNEKNRASDIPVSNTINDELIPISEIVDVFFSIFIIVVW